MESMSDEKTMIIKTIHSMVGSYSAYDIFADWVECMALAFANQIQFNQKRENAYKDLMKKYTEDQRTKLVEMFAWLVEWADREMTDMLGWIYMHLEFGSKHLGQFFTPYHICQTMAQLHHFDENDVDEFTANEPTCGAGGNIIALAEAMKMRGINYQQKLDATLQDLDVKAVYMSYVQMTLYGIPAVVFQSDTLLDPNGTNSSTGRLYTFGYVLKHYGILEKEVN